MDCKTITIFGNKGGVGKTFIAVNLATALANAKKRVLIVDLDMQAGLDMSRMFNLKINKSICEIAGVLGASETGIISDSAVKHSSGVHFIPTVASTEEISEFNTNSIFKFFQKAKEEYDFIIVDGCSTFSEVLINVLDCSNLLLLVATPDILAVTQIKKSLEVFKSLQFPSEMIRLVLNRSESRGSVAWKQVQDALTSEILAHIPSDGKIVGMSLNTGVPCVLSTPSAKVSESFKKMVMPLSKSEIYSEALGGEVVRSNTNLGKPGEFWNKFGVSVTPGAATATHNFESEQDVIDTLKDKVHRKLVERLNLDGITPEMMTDPAQMAETKKTAEEVIGNILREEGSGIISSREEHKVLVKDIVNEALGLGPIEDFLADPEVTDIMCNARDQLYIEKSGKLILSNKKFVSDQKMRAIIDRIIAPLGRRIDESTPMVDARLPDGSRINAIIPPLALNGPMLTIRKFAQERITVADLLEKYNTLTQDMADFLKAAVVARKNIIVSGGTGSGKTTLLNIVSEFIPDVERIITIEDAAELRLRKSHWGRLESRPANIEGRGQVTIRDLFINCLRMRPDRIIVGECRGGEVLDMLQAMNTGHDGSMTTLHANSTRDVMTRMQAMILLAGIELPSRAINEMISSAIDVIVQVNRFSDGTRKLTGISEVLPLTADFQLQLKDIFVFKQTGINSEGKIQGHFTPTGNIPSCQDVFETLGLKISKDMYKVSEK